MKKNIGPLAALALMAGVFAGGRADAQVIELKFADQLPPTHVASRAGNLVFMKMVEEATKGRVKFVHYPAQQLAKAAGMLDAVRNRVADIAMVGVVYVSDRMPLTGATELPGLFDTVVEGQAAFEKLARNDLMPYFTGANLRPLWTMTTPPYQLLFVRDKPIADISELKGMKLRTAGATSQLVAQSLGAVPVNISPADTYLALERGTVEGSIYTLSVMSAYKLEEVTKSYTTNAQLGTVAFLVFINEDVWKSLPADIQQTMAEIGQKVGVSLAQEIQKAEDATIEKLRSSGKQVYALPDAVKKQFSERLATVQAKWVEQMKERNLPGDRVLASFKKYLSEKPR